MIQPTSTEKEKVARAYYTGFATHDLNMILDQLAEGFTFTSPAGDDHIPIEEFKKRCWPTNAFHKAFSFIKTAESGDDFMLLVEMTTTDNKLVRNLDVFSFEGGKIKAIEVFFGVGAWFPGSGK